MASIFERNGVWWIQYYDRGRRIRKSLETTSKRIATREKTALEAKLLEPKRLVKPKRDAKVEEFWTAYQEWAGEHLAPATIDLHERVWGYLLEHCKPERLGHVRPEDIESFKRWRRRKEGNSEQSVNNYLRDLQAIFNRAIDWGYWTGENPVASVDRYKVTGKLISFHTEEELLKLLDAVTKEKPTVGQRNLEWAVLLGGWAGLRKKEIVNARWEWFTFGERPTIQIREIAGFTIKTREERIIPMSRRIYDALYPRRKEKGFVFESSRASEGRCRYRFDPKKSLEQALKKAGLEAEEPFQRLRRTFGSMHLQKGKPLIKVARWMGHSPKVCERHYAGLLDYDEGIDSF